MLCVCLQGLLAAILGWRPAFDAAVASGDEDMATEICRVVITMGDSHHSMLLESQDAAELAQVRVFFLPSFFFQLKAKISLLEVLSGGYRC